MSNPSTTGFTVVTERWPGETPWWACTFCSAVAGVRWMRWRRSSMPPKTKAEVKALARVSGDSDLKGGSNVDQMVRAVRARYGITLVKRSMTSAQVRAWAMHPGEGMIVGVWASKMPASIRHFYGAFGGGHRTFVVATGRKNAAGKPLVRVYDPMMPSSSKGVVITADALNAAMWHNEVVRVTAP